MLCFLNDNEKQEIYQLEPQNKKETIKMISFLIE